MIKITKKLVVFLLLIITLLPLTACHGSSAMKSFSMPAEFDTAKTYNITFWAKNDTNKTQTEIYKNAISNFEALYPNITVTLRLYTDYGKIYNDVITNISTNTTPNVCITYPDHIATYMTGANVVVPLDTLFTNEDYGLAGYKLKFDSPTFDELIPSFINECHINEHYYAIPFMRSTEACYVNKTYVEALGYELPDVLTWDFIWEVSEAATEKNEDGTYVLNNQKVLIPFIYKSTDNMMIQMLKQQNAEYSTENGDVMLFNEETKSQLLTIASHVQTGAFSTFKISGYPANFLNAGQCIFAVDSTAGATWMGTNAPLCDISEDSLVNFETAVMTVPQYDSDNPKMISQGPSICIFNKSDSGEVLASWLFAQYLLTDEVQIAYAQTEGYIPVTSKAQSSAKYQDYLSRIGENNGLYYDVKINAALLLLSHMEDTFITPVYNGSASLRDSAGALIENVVKSIRRKETVDDSYFENLYTNVSSLYRIEQTEQSVSGKKDLGKLPATAILLLSALFIAWLTMVSYIIIINFVKKKKNH